MTLAVRKHLRADVRRAVLASAASAALPSFYSSTAFSHCQWSSQFRTSMCLGLLSQDGIQPDRQPYALATGRQQRSIEREGRRLGSIQSL